MSIQKGRNGNIRTLQLGMSWLPEQAGNGLDRVYYALTKHLPDVDVEVTGLVAGSSKVAESSNHRISAFAADHASLPHRFGGMRKSVRQLLNTHHFDLVASHFALYTFPILNMLSDRPLVVHFHGPWAHESEVEGDNPVMVKAKAALERAVYRKGTRFIVLSKAFQTILHEKYDVPWESISIVPGGVEVEQFDTGLSQEEARERLGWPQDRPLFLSVRRLARRMGLENLISAMKTVVRDAPHALLYIAGKGPIAEELQAHIDALGLSDNVSLLGYVAEEDLPLAYRAATCSIVPTITLEGFGLITVESLAAGTPVLVTPRGGLPEVVSDLSPNLVFAGHEVNDLAERLVGILNGTIELPSSEACQHYARTRYDWSVVAQRTREVYAEVIS